METSYAPIPVNDKSNGHVFSKNGVAGRPLLMDDDSSNRLASSLKYLGSLCCCESLLDNSTGAFSDEDESRFLKELELAVSDFNEQYSILLKEARHHNVAKVWEFSRRARSTLLALIDRHDQCTSYCLARTWASRLNEFPFFTCAGISNILIALSDSLECRKEPVSRDCDTFTRTNYKFLLKVEDLVDVTCSIMPHLPIYVFKKNGDVFSTIHSMYLDSEDLALYHGKCSKLDGGAKLLRMRWYDSDNPMRLFAETKVSKDRVNETPAYKTRAPFDRSSLTALLRTQSGGGLGPSVATESDDGKVLERFRDDILGFKAEPVLRTVARRICFQIPGDASVRITIDFDFEAVLEDWQLASGVNRRYPWQFDVKAPPFVQHSGERALRFPHAIVEVKLESQDYKPDMPEWLNHIVHQQYDMREVDISKYQFAVATLLKNRISIVPEFFQELLIMSSNHDTTQPNSTTFDADTPSTTSKVARRIDPRVLFRLENLTLSWFGIASLPFGSVVWSGHRISKGLHLAALATSIFIVVYACGRYQQRIGALQRGDPIHADIRGMLFAATCLMFYAFLYIFIGLGMDTIDPAD